MIYFFTIPNWIKRFFKDFIWHIDTSEKAIYLTFDDGPIPSVTEFVLDELDKYNAKATFFCVGDNIHKHPEIFRKVLDRGHAFGNHTYNHLKGWQTENDVYFENILKFENQINFFSENVYRKKVSQTKLLRPPYGRIKSSQANFLKDKYKIIMWDVLTCDYDKKLDAEKCLINSIKYTRSGSIVVFHDSVKSENKLKYVLPKFLEYFTNQGFTFKKLEE